jgi:hypothetical protein
VIASGHEVLEPSGTRILSGFAGTVMASHDCRLRPPLSSGLMPHFNCFGAPPLCFEHDLVGKPVPTFPDHALEGCHAAVFMDK